MKWNTVYFTVCKNNIYCSIKLIKDGLNLKGNFALKIFSKIIDKFCSHNKLIVCYIRIYNGWNSYILKI